VLVWWTAEISSSMPAQATARWGDMPRRVWEMLWQRSPQSLGRIGRPDSSRGSPAGTAAASGVGPG
jgi:hypothetical protein